MLSKYMKCECVWVGGKCVCVCVGGCLEEGVPPDIGPSLPNVVASGATRNIFFGQNCSLPFSLRSLDPCPFEILEEALWAKCNVELWFL
jgi:hypothetical protein